MQPEVRFTVPGEPRGWQRAGAQVAWSGKTGRPFVHHYTQKATRSEQSGIRYIAQAAMQGQSPLDGPLDLEASFFFPFPAKWSAKKRAEAEKTPVPHSIKPDVDNLVKLVCDSLNKVVWTDDARVCRSTIQKLYAANPRIEVVIRSVAA